jgi:hypothetical protein
VGDGAPPDEVEDEAVHEIIAERPVGFDGAGDLLNPLVEASHRLVHPAGRVASRLDATTARASAGVGLRL